MWQSVWIVFRFRLLFRKCDVTRIADEFLKLPICHGRCVNPETVNAYTCFSLSAAHSAWAPIITIRKRHHPTVPPDEKHLANTWQGSFPHENLATDGYERTSPVMSYPPNGY